MFLIRVCPICEGQFVEEVKIACLENLGFETEEQARKYILENVTVKTAQPKEELIPNLRSVLKTSIPDEALYNKVVEELRSAFKENI